MEYVTLKNGVKMPMLGFGTISQTGEQITDNVAFALNHGYELIDTANRYGNETEVGRGLKKSGKKREDYFLETKLGPTLYENEEAIDDTLKRLDTDYIDLMILHHPVNNYLHAWGMLEKAYKQGKLRAIGLSNFPQEKTEEVIAHCTVEPMVMQAEGHPYFPAEHVREVCDKYDIRIQCWYPLGHGGLLSDPVICDLAEKYHKSPAQIVLRWHIQKGFCPVPGSKSPEHIKANAEIFDFALSDEDMRILDGLNKHEPFYHVTEESLHRMAVTKCNFEK